MINFALQITGGNGSAEGVIFAGLDLAWLSNHLKERGLAPGDRVAVMLPNVPYFGAVYYGGGIPRKRWLLDHERGARASERAA